jgi:hypothetical protein
MKIQVRLLQSIRDSAKHNPDVQKAPACILWPDHSRQWEAVIPRLQEELPELVIFGDSRPENRNGHAILRHRRLPGPSKEKPVTVGMIRP